MPRCWAKQKPHTNSWNGPWGCSNLCDGSQGRQQQKCGKTEHGYPMPSQMDKASSWPWSEHISSPIGKQRFLRWIFCSEVSPAVDQHNTGESQAARKLLPLWAVGAEIIKWSLIVLPSLQPFSFSKSVFRRRKWHHTALMTCVRIKDFTLKKKKNP